ncbi:MAG: hypothetical protein U9O83_07640, partial [Campylobacterota bacterium]|nr:hypothetical protein [Campylobacterota bacterium]
YSAMIPSAFQTSMQFLLQEALTEKNIEKSEVEIEIAKANLSLTERQVAKLEQDIELSKVQSDDSLLTSIKQREQISTGIIQAERQTTQLEQSIRIADSVEVDRHTSTLLQDESIKVQVVQGERQVTKLEQEIELSKVQVDDQLLSSTKQRDKLDVDTALTSRQVLNAEKDIDIKSKQIEGMDKDNLVKDQNILNAKVSVSKSEREVAILERNIAKIEEDTDYVKLQKESLKVQTLDTYGFSIDLDTYTADSSENTMHHQNVEIGKSKVLVETQNAEIAKQNLEGTKIDVITKEAALETDYGKTSLSHHLVGTRTDEGTTPSTVTPYYELIGPEFTYPTDTDNAKYTDLHIVVSSSSAVTASTLQDIEVGDTTATLPPSRFHAEMMKARTEANIAINTSKGYLGDAFFKQAKILQELTFSLSTAGVINTDNTTDSDDKPIGIYADLAKALETTLNGMSTVYGTPVSKDYVTPFINIHKDTAEGAAESASPSFSEAEPEGS